MGTCDLLSKKKQQLELHSGHLKSAFKEETKLHNGNLKSAFKAEAIT